MSNGWPERPLTPEEERDLPVAEEIAKELDDYREGQDD